MNEIKALTEELLQANHAYYDLDDPIMSDSEYDRKIHRLAELEKQYPDQVIQGSPTLRVGGQATFNPVVHEYAMLSMKDVFTLEDVVEFTKKHVTSEYVVEPKIDGLSLQVEYMDGILVMASTRGDGRIGEDVTENAKCIADLPKRINARKRVVVHGEVYMLNADFERMNRTYAEAGLKQMANPRNAAAGTLRQRSPQVVRERRLHFFAFTLENAYPMFTRHSDALQWLRDLGFSVVESKVTTDPCNVINNIGRYRSSLPYCIDGAAVKINDLKKQIELGNTSKFPRWEVAFKYPAQTEETVLDKVIYQVGRTGKVTPVALFATVRLNGTRVNHAVLHNSRYMERLDLHQQDILTVYKAGEIIPEVLSAKRNRFSTEPIRFIETCPSCGSTLVRKGKSHCCNNLECPAQSLRRILHWTSKDALDIQGCGERTITLMMDAGLVNDVTDLYHLNIEQLLKLDKFGMKKAMSLLTEIERSKHAELDRLIYALGINSVGLSVATRLALEFGSFEKFAEATFSELIIVKDVGSLIAENVIRYLHAAKNQKLLNFIRDNFEIDWDDRDSDKYSLDGLSFVITGSLSVSRKEIEQLIINNGGRVTSRINHTTNYLVAGTGGGRKRSDAEEVGVEIITYEDLLKMVI